MNTRGGSQLYEHALIEYLHPAMCFDSGWYKWFADVIPSNSLPNRRRRVTILREPMLPGPQAVYLRDSLNEYADSANSKNGITPQTINLALRDLPIALTQDAYHEQISDGLIQLIENDPAEDHSNILSNYCINTFVSTVTVKRSVHLVKSLIWLFASYVFYYLTVGSQLKMVRSLKCMYYTEKRVRQEIEFTRLSVSEDAWLDMLGTIHDQIVAIRTYCNQDEDVH